MKLTVHIPDNCLAERRYIASLVFEEFLGLSVNLVAEPRPDVAIVGADGRELVLADCFFAAADKDWLGVSSLPSRPLRRFELPEALQGTSPGDDVLPVLFADSADAPILCCESPTRMRCSLDIFGTAFFLLTRYEEIASPVEDRWGRFPAKSSLACQEGFLYRPIVDEYVELLWRMLKLRWPGLERKQHNYRLFLSHDVDSPYRVLGRPPWQIALAAGADLVHGRGVRVATARLSNACRVYLGDDGADPYNTFEFIMSTSEAHSIQSAFYFITRRRRGRLDGTYRFQSREVQQLIRTLSARGHEIGLHPSYSTFCNGSYIANEYSLLRDQCRRLGVEQPAWGGRQHYLRWKNPLTWAAWDQVGLDYDSSVGFADDVGFRCGTCREFPVYDLVERRRLRLRERPLIVMECAMTYRLPQPHEACFDRVTQLVDRCRRVGGNFTLLWHNSNLVSPEQREWYRRLVAHAA